MSWDDSTTDGLSGLGGALLLVICGVFWSLVWIIGGLVPFGLLAGRPTDRPVQPRKTAK